MSGINSGEVISVDDFPQDPNGLENHGVRTKPNGLIDGEWIDPTQKENLSLGEDISLVSSLPTPVTVPKKDLIIGESEIYNQNTGDSDAPYPAISATGWYLFCFTPSVDIALTELTLGNMAIVAPKVEIYLADGSNEPTGALLDTLTTTNTSGSTTSKIFTSSMNPVLASGTKYCFVLKVVSGSGTGYLHDTNTGGLTQITSDAITTNSGASWSHDTSSVQVRIFIIKGADELLSAGKAYLADKDIESRSFIDGFLSEAGLKDDVKEIITSGYIDGFATLTAGEKYFLASGGGITLTDDNLLNTMIAKTIDRIELTQPIENNDDLYPVSVSSALDSGIVLSDGLLFGTIGGSGVAVTFTVTTGGVTFTTVSTTTGKQGFCIPVKKDDAWSVTASLHAIYLRTQY